ncbi:MAG: FecR domain-containing protein [Pseudomonadota bacterium]
MVAHDVAEEAAAWLLRMQESPLNEADQAQFKSWYNTSAMHSEAWRRAEKMLVLRQAPKGLPNEAIKRLHSLNRRQAIKSLAAVIITAPLAWHSAIKWPAWSAELRTGKQRKVCTLDDNSTVVLNADSAVDIAFSAIERRLLLHAGEILITTHSDSYSKNRPFLVETGQGLVQALGTRFSVKTQDDTSSVAVYEKAVSIESLSSQRIELSAGQQIKFSTHKMERPNIISQGADAWSKGFFAADQIELQALARHLAQYRHGFIRVHPDIATLPISGTFSIDDTDSALSLLEKTRPVSIDRRLPFLVMINPR